MGVFSCGKKIVGAKRPYICEGNVRARCAPIVEEKIVGCFARTAIFVVWKKICGAQSAPIVEIVGCLARTAKLVVWEEICGSRSVLNDCGRKYKGHKMPG